MVKRYVGIHELFKINLENVGYIELYYRLRGHYHPASPGNFASSYKIQPSDNLTNTCNAIVNVTLFLPDCLPEFKLITRNPKYMES